MVKQVILIRLRYPDGKGGTFKIRTGKIAAQIAHASMKVFFDRGTFETIHGDADQPCMVIPLTAEMESWVRGIFTKIVLYVETEEDLLQAYSLAQEAGLPCSLIMDVGLTEFREKCETCMGLGTLPEHMAGDEPLISPEKIECPICHGTGKKGTRTCVAIGPAEASKIDRITGPQGRVKTRML